MEFKTEITSELNEKRINYLFPKVVEELEKGNIEKPWGDELLFKTTLYQNGGAIFLRENGYYPAADGKYDSYSWGMITIDKNGCNYYQLTDDMNRETLPKEERERILSELGPEIPLEKKATYSLNEVSNAEYMNAFENFVDLASSYSKNAETKSL